MESVNLRSCPFCGGPAVFVPDMIAPQANMQGWRFYIACSGCGVSYKNKSWQVLIKFSGDGNIIFVRDDRPEALALWNGKGCTEMTEEGKDDANGDIARKMGGDAFSKVSDEFLADYFCYNMDCKKCWLHDKCGEIKRKKNGRITPKECFGCFRDWVQSTATEDKNEK